MSSPKNLPKQPSDNTFKLEQQIFKQEDKGDFNEENFSLSPMSSPTRSNCHSTEKRYDSITNVTIEEKIVQELLRQFSWNFNIATIIDIIYCLVLVLALIFFITGKTSEATVLTVFTFCYRIITKRSKEKNDILYQITKFFQDKDKE